MEVSFAPNSMFLEENVRQEIMRLSALNYTPGEMALYFGLDATLFCKDAAYPGTDINTLIRQGKMINKVLPELKLQELAEGGNITAIQELQKLIKQRSFESIIQQLDEDEF